MNKFGLTRDPTTGMQTGGYIDAHGSSINQLGLQNFSPTQK